MPDRDPQDVTREELIKQMETMLSQNPGMLIWVKWTCPKCGERATSSTPNTFNMGGYIHDEPYCGSHYTGQYYGMLVAFGVGGAEDEPGTGRTHEKDRDETG